MYLIPAILFSGCIVFNVSLFLEKRMGYSNKISKKISFRYDKKRHVCNKITRKSEDHSGVRYSKAGIKVL